MADRAGTVIVGGGQAGAEVAFALRAARYADPITLICGEEHLPYERPPLSKGVLEGVTDPARLLIRSERAYEAKSIEVRTATHVVAIDRAAHAVRTAAGESLPYARLVLATGAEAIRPVWARSSRIHTIRDLEDALAIAPRATDRVAVIGGSFLGLEAASSLSSLVASVTVIEAAGGVLPGRVSSYTAKRIQAIHESRGVRFLLGESVTAIDESDGEPAAERAPLRIRLSDGACVDVDWAVLSIGARPRGELARDCAIETTPTGGVLVDAHCRSNDPDVLAIGDVAVVRAAGGAVLGVESVASAMAQARVAAATIVGTPPPTARPETFWSEQFGTQLRIAGLVASDRRVIDDVRQTAGEGFVVRRTCDGSLVCVEAFDSPREYALGLRELITTHEGRERE